MTQKHDLESVPDVVLRLAQRELAEEIAPPLEPFFEPAEGADAARSDTSQQGTDFKSQIENRKLQNDGSSNLQFAFFNSQFAIPADRPARSAANDNSTKAGNSAIDGTPPDPPLRRGGDTKPVGWNDAERGVRTHGLSPSDRSAEPAFNRAPTDPADLVSAACGPNLPPLHQRVSQGIPLMIPPLRKGGPGGVLSDAEGTANSPFDDTQPAGDQGAPRLMDAIDDHGRHFEQVLSDLEQSLSRLFTTQIEILNHLGDTARQHERRWQEQSTTRRATYSV
jgi:hypothetical protein